MSIRGEKILVAGGSGLVGSNLTSTLIETGVKVSSSYCSRVPTEHFEYYKKYDFTDQRACLEAAKNQDCIIICALPSFGIAETKKNPTAHILPSLKIFSGLLEAAVAQGVGRVIVISSSTIYHETSHPIEEHELDLNRPPAGQNHAAGSMYRYIEQLCNDYHRAHKLPIGIVRTSNIYGPNDRFEDHHSHVVPALIRRALNKDKPFVVWGNEDTVRDFIYVDDFIDGLLSILEQLCTCDPVHVCHGDAMRIGDAVSTILEVCGHKCDPTFDQTKPSGIPYRAFSMAKYTTLFGEPRRTPFSLGISKTVEWYTRHR